MAGHKIAGSHNAGVRSRQVEQREKWEEAFKLEKLLDTVRELQAL